MSPTCTITYHITSHTESLLIRNLRGQLPRILEFHRSSMIHIKHDNAMTMTMTMTMTMQ